MMSELKDAIDWMFKWSFVEDATKRDLVVNAAKRYANPDIEAATEIINRLRYIETGDEWDDKIEDITAEAVNKALGIITKGDG